MCNQGGDFARMRKVHVVGLHLKQIAISDFPSLLGLNLARHRKLGHITPYQTCGKT